MGNEHYNPKHTGILKFIDVLLWKLKVKSPFDI